jgi:hypothetical protein
MRAAAMIPALRVKTLGFIYSAALHISLLSKKRNGKMPAKTHCVY